MILTLITLGAWRGWKQPIVQQIVCCLQMGGDNESSKLFWSFLDLYPNSSKVRAVVEFHLTNMTNTLVELVLAGVWQVRPA